MSSPEAEHHDPFSSPRAESGEFPASQRHPSQVRRGRVLVVDDEPQIGTTLRLLLEPRHEVVPVTSGKAALERLTTDGAFDVVLCDLKMPEMSGIDLYEIVAVVAPAVLDRFVFMTGGVFSAKISAFLGRVPNPCIDKPFDIAALTALIDERAAHRTDEVA